MFTMTNNTQYFFTFFILIVLLFSASTSAQTINEQSKADICPSSKNISTKLQSESSEGIWDIAYQFSAEGPGQYGVETDGEHIYTNDWRHDATHTFWKYTMDGTFIESFNIAGVTQIRDMAYDGTYFYGSNVSMTLYVLDLPNKTLVDTISVSCTSINGIRHIAYDPELDGGNGGFWVGNWNNLGAIDMDGNEIYANIGPTITSIAGSAYDPYTEGGPYLWMFTQLGSNTVDIYQFEIASQTFTGVMHDCSDAPGYNGGIAGGVATYDNGGMFTLLADIQQDPNLIVAYELAPVHAEQLNPPVAPFSAFIPARYAHLARVTTLLAEVRAMLSDDVPEDVQATLDEVEMHVSNASATANTIYAQDQLRTAGELLENLLATL
ncbi:hypothetical protein EF808_03400 [archaeon]|nr:MAG: hypothetical protein EF808_03400 [archaeon]